MLIKECDYILKVYQEKSFSRAAEKLYITQPALSIAVKRFEEKLGVNIFDRSKSPLQLTSEGEYFISVLQNILAQEAEMYKYFAKCNANKTGYINIISTGYYFSYILPSLITSFCEKYQGYTIHSFSVDASKIEDEMNSGLIDMCCTVMDIYNEKFERKVLSMENLILAVPSTYTVNDSLEKYRLTFEQVRENNFFGNSEISVPISYFKDTPFLMLQKCNDLSIRANKIFQCAGIVPNIILCLDQMLTTYYVAAAGIGAAFIRADLLNNVEPTNKLFFYKIDDPRMERSVKLYYLKEKAKSNIYTDFIHFLKM